MNLLSHMNKQAFDKQDRTNDSPRLERVSSDMTKDDIIEYMLFPSNWNLPRFLVK